MHSEPNNQESNAQQSGENVPFAWECGERPEPPLNIMECQRKHLCITWMRTGICCAENCPYNHHMPVELQCQVVLTASDIGNLLGGTETQRAVSKKGMVLMDSGANEVVRPFSNWEWAQIENKKPFTRKMNAGLAMGSAMEAGITMGGELMRAPPKYTHFKGNEGDCNWICPMGRCRNELGMDFHWTSKGPRISGGMLREPIYGVVIGGLPFLTWDQFQVVRYGLQQSHQGGRKPAKKFCGEDGPPPPSHPEEWPEWCHRHHLNIVKSELDVLMAQSLERDPVYPKINNKNEDNWNLANSKRGRSSTYVLKNKENLK